MADVQNESSNFDTHNGEMARAESEREFLHLIANHLSVTVGYLKRLNRKLQANDAISDDDIKESVLQAYTASEKLNDLFCERRSHLKSTHLSKQPK